MGRLLSSGTLKILLGVKKQRTSVSSLTDQPGMLNRPPCAGGYGFRSGRWQLLSEPYRDAFCRWRKSSRRDVATALTGQLIQRRQIHIEEIAAVNRACHVPINNSPAFLYRRIQ